MFKISKIWTLEIQILKLAVYPQKSDNETEKLVKSA